jgi:hypothetical protein
MARQKTGGSAWRWPGNVRVDWLTFALMVALCPGDALRAADSALSSSLSSNATVALLDYQETDQGVINRGVSLTMQTIPFKKEPASVSGKIVRGILNFGDEASQAIPFLWQCDTGKLYLDLNRNHDLTDDPSGVFVARRAEPVYYQSFTNVHLPFNTASGRCRVLADLNFYRFGSQANCHVTVRSFWQGKLTLQGRDWQAGIVPNVVDQPGSFEVGRLLLRPWEERNRPFNGDDGSLASVPFSRKLFVDGHAYKLDCIARPQNGEARPALQFTEQSVPLGALNITGQFIRRLVLTGGPYLVKLDKPAGVVKIPVGSYIQPDIRLEQNGVEAFCKASQQQVGSRITVDDKTTAVLHAGGPLTNSVVTSRHGQDLRLDYRLAGVGGETYQPVMHNRSKPPEFAIYKGAKKVASGTFEFG